FGISARRHILDAKGAPATLCSTTAATLDGSVLSRRRRAEVLAFLRRRLFQSGERRLALSVLVSLAVEWFRRRCLQRRDRSITRWVHGGGRLDAILRHCLDGCVQIGRPA